jgi:hypothetical protein
MRRAGIVLGILVLLALTWFGLRGGIGEWSQAETLGQRIQVAAQFAYGLFSVLTIVSVFRRGPFARIVRPVWLAAITVAGAMAPVVWGGGSLLSGILAGLAAIVIGLLILWLLRPEW